MRAIVFNIDSSPSLSVLVSLREHCDLVVGAVDERVPPWLYLNTGYDLLHTLHLPSSSRLLASHDTNLDDEEEAWLQDLLRYCTRYDINIIYPSHDHSLFLLSKVRDALDAAGIIVIAPTFRSYLRATDKWLVIEEASSVGLPIPRSELCTSVDQALRTACLNGYPIVVKARQSTGSSWVRLVDEPSALEVFARRLRLLGRDLVVQEYVPGGRERSLHFLMRPDGSCALRFTLRKPHHLGPSLSTAIQVVPDPPEMDCAEALVRSLDLSGFVVMQTKLDARDGTTRLIEINPRLGFNGRMLLPLLRKQAIDLPWLVVQLAQGESVPDLTLPVGITASSPVEDLAAGWLALRLGSVPASRPGNTMPRRRQLLRSYLHHYAARPVVDDYFRALRTNPLASLAHYSRLWVALREGSGPSTTDAPWGDLHGM